VLEMNGFVQFEHQEDLEGFLAAPRVASIKASGRVSRTSSQPVVVFHELSGEDLSDLKELAETHGGKVKPSVQYEPL
jgi:hypothetical protein